MTWLFKTSAFGWSIRALIFLMIFGFGASTATANSQGEKLLKNLIEKVRK